tara:strand:+ start:684 stop:3131 length:2448 start_codon:yes stop_codon:yes gene_type:complete
MTLRSTSTIKILDLLCEGPIEGFAEPLEGKLSPSIFLNDNPVELEGEESFDLGKVNAVLKFGTKNQDIPKGFHGAKKTENISIDEEVGTNYSETLTAKGTVKSRDYGSGQILKKITTTDAEVLTIFFTIPALFSQAMVGIASGQLFSAKIKIEVFIKGKGGKSFKKAFKEVIRGVSTTNYQFSKDIELINDSGSKPFGEPPYIIKIKKVTDEEDDYDIKFDDLVNLTKKQREQTPFEGKRANRLICTSFALKSLSTTKINNMACVGLTFSSEAFPQLPTRSYLIKGKKVRIFSNATVRTGKNNAGSLKFEGEFDGNFLQSIDDQTGKATDLLVWTTCPVCIFIDMMTNPTYGAGDFISDNNISLVDLYPLARYCNELVDIPDDESDDASATVKEPRFAMNTIIGNQVSAYKLLQNMASVFRGMTYWASNTVNVAADHGNLDGSDIDPVHLYNNSSVIGGVFSYSGTSVKTRSTKIRINYNDPKNNYKVDQVVVQNSSLIDKFGLQEKEIVAFGCTSKYQAIRMGQYMLKSEELDGEVVTFSTGLDGLFVLPGQVFAIGDLMRAGQRTGGRVSSATTTVITTDQTVQLPSGDNKKLSCILSDGTLETKDIDSSTGTTITVSSAFTSAPLAQSVYVISTDNVQKQKFRCIDIKDNNNGTYTITGVQHNDSIYDIADNTIESLEEDPLEERDISTFDDTPRKPTDLVVSFTQVKVNNGMVNRALFQWSRGTNGPSIQFDIRLDVNDGPSVSIDNYTQTTFEIDSLKVGEIATFKVRSVGILPDKKSKFTTLEKEVPSVTTSSSTGSFNTTTELPPDPE